LNFCRYIWFFNWLILYFYRLILSLKFFCYSFIWKKLLCFDYLLRFLDVTDWILLNKILCTQIARMRKTLLI
jgi:hypothetical protein